MTINQVYVLARNATFTPASKLEQATQKELGCNESDTILTLNRSRNGSTILDNEGATLLQHFQTPRSLAAAVIQYAKLTNQDPQQVADSAFPLLAKMQAEGYLVIHKETPTIAAPGVLPAGLRIGKYTICSACQALEHGVVYKVADARGALFALKIFHQCHEQNAAYACAHETAVLQALDGTVNPAFVETGSHDGLPFFVMEWCDGVTCDRAAAAHRNFNTLQNMLALVDICLAVVKAYSHLHQQGVMHGDVHPNNVLVAADGTVKLVDYGYSAREGSQQRGTRGGVSYYYEPELATALLRRENVPPATKQGELYSLAALLYQVFTGHFYLPFAPDLETIYQQIANDTPQPFCVLDIPVPPLLHKAFEKAFAKDSASRFATASDFAAALQQSRSEMEKSRFYFIEGKINAEEHWLNFLIHKYGWESELLKKGLSYAPSCSVNFGAAGIAYLFYRMACVREDVELMAIAHIWANRASSFNSNYERAFYNSGESLTETTVGSGSLYHSPAGVHLIQALVSSGSNNLNLLSQAVQDFAAVTGASCRRLELTTGRAGLLVGAALLFRERNTSQSPELQALATSTNHLLKELWSELDTYPNLALPNPIGYFGMAHGWAGVLYATLLWCQTSGSPLPAHFEKRIEELLAQAIATNGVLQWPVSPTEPQHWTGWCHGNVGYVFLWSLLYRHFGEQSFLEIAQKTAIPLMYDRQEVPHLCCGLAGQAYALNRLFSITGNSIYQKRVKRLKKRIIGGIGEPDLRNNSLYKGEVGIGVLLCELTRPAMARMPLFE